jgi:hypothetical protein
VLCSTDVCDRRRIVVLGQTTEDTFFILCFEYNIIMFTLLFLVGYLFELVITMLDYDHALKDYDSSKRKNNSSELVLVV